MPPIGLPLRHGDTSDLGERLSFTSRNNQAWQFKGWSQSVTAPTAEPDLKILLLYVLMRAHPGIPEM